MNPPRVAIYGHDSLGLGHLRRNLAIAAAMARSPARPDVLVVSSAVEATGYDLPDGVDLLLTPGVRKDDHGRYGARRLRGGLDAVLAIRRAAIAAGVDAFAPDLLVIDKVPFGLGGELIPLIDRLNGTGTRVVLGLRDVLDEPAVARREWRSMRMADALRRHVDEVWVYGDQRVHDLGLACAVPPVLRRRLRYTGYLSTGRDIGGRRPPGVPEGVPYVLGTVGGGQDGADLARLFVASDAPKGCRAVLVAGSQMPAVERAELHRAATARNDLVVVDFDPGVARWVAGARAVVCMGGYNTVAEVLATSTPALVVPRRQPRAEQAVRADALAAGGHLESVDITSLTPGRLSSWLSVAVARRRSNRRGIDLEGLATVTDLSGDLLRVRTQKRLHAVAG